MTTTLIDDINTLTSKYNRAIGTLENNFNLQSYDMTLSKTRRLKRSYAKEYDSLAAEYKEKRRQLINDYVKANPQWSKARKLWGWLFVAGAIISIICCGAALPSDDQPATVSKIAESAEPTYWNAENIPIPYLQDSTQYVSNPDNVLSQDAVDIINANMKKIEQDFDIQSVVIIVNHIENDDPFRMAQDVGNKYGVGRNDRGLMVVVGYEDHKINISPGRSLEGDLTDVECYRLQQQYVVPGMKAEMPDSAMIYLSEALYAHLQKKELPQMSTLLDDGNEEEVFGAVGLCACFLVAWFIFFTYKNKKYLWVPSSSMTSLMDNPFYEAVVSGGPVILGGGHHSGGSFGGGGFGGGSFGGGSFGGGGATSSW